MASKVYIEKVLLVSREIDFWKATLEIFRGEALPYWPSNRTPLNYFHIGQL